MKNQFDRRRLLLFASVILFATSLTQDCFYIDREDRDAWASGFGLLLIGWLGVFDAVFAWFANPLLVTAWLFTFVGRCRMFATSSAMLALAFSLSFLAYGTILTNEAGGRSAITEYAWGYWLWILSIACAIVAALLIEEPMTPVEIWDGDAHLAQRVKELEDRS